MVKCGSRLKTKEKKSACEKNTISLHELMKENSRSDRECDKSINKQILKWRKVRKKKDSASYGENKDDIQVHNVIINRNLHQDIKKRPNEMYQK